MSAVPALAEAPLDSLPAPGPVAPTVIAPGARGTTVHTLASVQAVAAWFLRKAYGRKLEFLEQSVAVGTSTDPDLCPSFPAVAVFARKPGGADDWLGFACGEAVTGSRDFRAVVERVRSAGGLAA